MNIDIRQYIRNNFKNSTREDVRQSIEDSITKREEITLPGLGCLFEVLWQNSDESCRDKIVDTINKNLA